MGLKIRFSHRSIQTSLAIAFNSHIPPHLSPSAIVSAPVTIPMGAIITRITNDANVSIDYASLQQFITKCLYFIIFRGVMSNIFYFLHFLLRRCGLKPRQPARVDTCVYNCPISCNAELNLSVSVQISARFMVMGLAYKLHVVYNDI